MYIKFKLIFSLMDHKDKRRLFWVFTSGLIAGILNVVGIASILPFISVISEPELIESNEYIKIFSEVTGIKSLFGIILSFGLISFVMILFGNIVNVYDIWLSAKFGFYKEKQLSKKLLSIYLDMNQLEFNNRKIAERVKNILTEIDRVIIDTLFEMMDLITGIVVATLVFSLLLFINVQAAIIITCVLIFAYLIIYIFTSDKLNKLGEEFTDIETDLYANVMETLKNHQEIKLSQKTQFFAKRYNSIFSKMIKNQIKLEFISLIPQQIIEITAFGSIIFLAIYFSVGDSSGFSVVAMLSMYAFAAYRLMPVIAEIFDSFEKIQFGSAILKRLIKDFNGEVTPTNKNIKVDSQSKLSRMKIFKKLDMRDICFSYSNSNHIFSSLSISISANQFHCIVGKTGRGKSTLLNLIAGLYLNQSGEITVDGNKVQLYENSRWFEGLSYIPPNVQLIEGSVLENIALGERLEDIDREKVIKYSKLVDLNAHIITLAAGYNTIIGSEGTSLSSGQSQKIGIARALYQEPSLLLLDESTDALDITSERLVLEALKKIESLTIVFVSHRLSVKDFADSVIDLDQLLKG